MDLSSLRAQAQQFVQQHQQEVIDDISRLVAVKSVRGEAGPHAPFGPGPRRALDAALAMAGEMGLQCADYDYLGKASVPGSGEKTIGIVAHLDVVPEGGGWNSDPYTLTQKEGWLIGRGVVDDKGPAVLALWAARFFAQQPQHPRHGIEVLLGCDEECGMSDLKRYLSEHRAPDFAFTPDGAFPVCNGEKGGFTGEFVSAPLHGVLLDFSGGFAHNVVPDHADALVRLDAAGLPAAEGITISPCSEGARIEATGIAAHASTPEGSRSAIGMIASYLLALPEVTGVERNSLELVYDLAVSHDGEKLGIASCDGIFTPLTIIGGEIWMKDGILTQNLDCRYPTSITGEEIAAKLAQRAEKAGMRLEHSSFNPPFYIQPDSPAILALRTTYRTLTGKDDTPFTMGGGTYARCMPNAVSFGIEEEKMTYPAFAGPIHAANEGFPIEKLMEALVIFICALGELMEVDL